MSETYDAGLLSDYGGGNVEWWQDYIRAELGHARDFYATILDQAMADARAYAEAAKQQRKWKEEAERQVSALRKTLREIAEQATEFEVARAALHALATARSETLPTPAEDAGR